MNLMRLLPLILFFAFASAASAQWTLTTADFNRQPVSLQAIDSAGLKVTPAGSPAPLVIGFDNFLQLDLDSPIRPSQGKFILSLVSGDKIAGDPAGFQGEQIVWKNAAVGELKVSLKNALAMYRAAQAPNNLDQARTDDLISLANGDSVKGVISNITESKVVISAGNELAIPLDSIRFIQFAVAVKPKAAPVRAFRVRLSDGSTLTATNVAADAANLTLTLAPNDQRQLPLSAIFGIEQLNGPVSWLSSRAPDSVVQTPYFGSLAWPTRMNETVGGKPIRFNDQTFARGIGVHAYSRLDYALDGSHEAFRTQYAIAQDDRRQFADVTVRIKLDGKAVHEQPHVKAETPPAFVIIDIPKTTKLLTLEVDYGDAYDTQDRFNWIEPALLRKKPPAP